MGKNKQSLIEEINRIKSLFSEDRLWGNLTESTDDECIDQLEGEGYLVSPPGSTENNVVRNDLLDCLYVGGDRNNPSTLHKIYEKINSETTNIDIGIQPKGSGCMLVFQNKGGCADDLILSSIWEDNNYDWNVQVLYKFKKPFEGVEGIDIQIYYLGWEGILDPLTLNYTLKFAGLYRNEAKHIPASKKFDTYFMKSQIGKDELDADDNGTNDLDPFGDTTHPKYGEFLTDQTGINLNGNFITDIIKNPTGFCIGGMAEWKEK